MGEEPSPFVSNEIQSIERIAELLELRAADYEQRFRQVAATEEIAVKLFDRFSAVMSRDSAERLYQDVHAKCWADVVRFLLRSRSFTDAGWPYEHLCGQTDLTGAVLAYLWSLDPKEAVSVVASSLAASIQTLSPDRRHQLLAYLTFSQLQDLAKACPVAAPCVAEMVLMVALHSTECASMVFLEPLLQLESLPPSVHRALPSLP